MRALIEEMPKQRTMKEINMKVQDSDGVSLFARRLFKGLVGTMRAISIIVETSAVCLGLGPLLEVGEMA